MVTAFDYRIDWRPANRYPGDHVAAAAGDGGAFRGERLLTESSQFRRLSIRSRLRDPLKRWWIHEIQQRSAIDVVVCVDVSASMRVGDAERLTLAGDLVESAALAAHRNGDRVGLYCAAATLAPTLSMLPGRAASRLLPIAGRLRALGAGAPPGTADGQAVALDSIDGMRDLWRRLPARRSLVLVVSDFLAPVATWDAILGPLTRHQVVPVIVERAVDALPPVRWGLVRLDDAESGASRVLWMRPALARRMAGERDAHRERMAALMARLRLRPLRLVPPYDPLVLTSYFLALAGPQRTARSSRAAVTARSGSAPDDAAAATIR